MAPNLLMRIPYLRRPFHQRDVARRERDAALWQVQEMRRSAQRAERAAAGRPDDAPPFRDVAAWFAAEQFYWRPDQDADQDARIGAFRHFVQTHVAKDRPTAEIGPSLSPVLAKRLGYDVTVVDHADQTALIEKYAAQNLDTSRIEPVDVVWTGGRLAPAMPRRDMAAIVACHMIEHATDFVGFLDDCTDMLADDGRIFLIVPDRRYCFDFMHASTDVAKVVEDHRLQRRLHSFASLYRLTTNMAARVGGGTTIAWGPHPIEDIDFVHGDPSGVIESVCAATDYIDGHENYFTPSSFVLLIEELRYLGLLRLAPTIVTRARGCEFLVVLAKREQDRPPLPEYLERKKFLMLNMLREERERLNLIGGLLDG
jgi:hypothetical protein